MKKTKISRYLIFIAFFTLVTVFLSILQKSYANLTVSNRRNEVTDTSKNINPELDLSVIDEIKNKQYINPSDLPESETSTSNVLLTIPTPTIATSSPSTVEPNQPQTITPIPTLIP